MLKKEHVIKCIVSIFLQKYVAEAAAMQLWLQKSKNYNQSIENTRNLACKLLAIYANRSCSHNLSKAIEVPEREL